MRRIVCWGIFSRGWRSRTVTYLPETMRWNPRLRALALVAVTAGLVVSGCGRKPASVAHAPQPVIAPETAVPVLPSRDSAVVAVAPSIDSLVTDSVAEEADSAADQDALAALDQ